MEYFRYFYDDRDVVSCGRDSELPIDAQHQYINQDPLNEHLHWLEARITHQLCNHIGIKWPCYAGSSIKPTSGPTNLLQHIAKKFPQILEAKELTRGMGLTSLAVGRVIAMFVVWHSVSLAILIWWLTCHQEDLQNAFAMLDTSLARLMIYLEILLRFRR